MGCLAVSSVPLSYVIHPQTASHDLSNHWPLTSWSRSFTVSSSGRGCLPPCFPKPVWFVGLPTKSLTASLFCPQVSCCPFISRNLHHLGSITKDTSVPVNIQELDPFVVRKRDDWVYTHLCHMCLPSTLLQCQHITCLTWKKEKEKNTQEVYFEIHYFSKLIRHQW